MKKQNKIDTILNKCCNLYGSPLSVSSRMKIKKYLSNPTPQGWDEICGIVIWNAPLINIWTQVCATDNTFSVLGRNYEFNAEKAECELKKEWGETPSPMQVVIALKKLHEKDEIDTDGESTYKYSSEVKNKHKFRREN